jgi:hemolysin activation/secretion protein
MAKNIKIAFILSSLLISFVAMADINDDVQRKQAQDRRQLELENTLKERSILKNKQQTVPMSNVENNAIELDKKCIHIKQINTTKQNLIDRQLIDKIKQKYQNRCLSIKQINNFAQALQNLYQQTGFVTTKVGLSIPQTQLKAGILDISIGIGLMDSIKFNSKFDYTTLAKQLIFDDLLNKPLNIYDINKRINHINRLNSHQAKLNIKPSDKQYHSKIVINDNQQDYQVFSVILDNSGSKSTGVNKLKLNADWDDFLMPLSKWSLNYAFPTDAEKDKKDSNAYTLDASFPYRDYLFNYNATKSDYDTNQMLTTGDIFYSFGNTTTKNFYLTKYLNKSSDQDSKIKLGLSLSDEESYSKLREVVTKNEVGSRKLSILSLDYERSFQLSNKSTLYLNPSVSKGIDAFDALDDNESGLDSKAQFGVFKFYGYYAKPLTLNNKQFNLMSSWNMQISEDELFAAQSFSIGGQSSVRGFKDESIAAKSGFYVQNNLSANLNQWRTKVEGGNNLTGTIFFDYGRIYPNSSDYQFLSGAGISINYQHKDIEIELTTAKNLKKPNAMNEDSANYFTIGYKF